MNFWERLEMLLEKHQMSARELGMKINISGASITGWKKGSLPGADVALNIAQLLDTTVEYLLTGQNPDGTTAEEHEFLVKIKTLDKIDQDAVFSLVDSLLKRY